MKSPKLASDDVYSETARETLESLSLNHQYLCSEIIHTKESETVLNLKDEREEKQRWRTDLTEAISQVMPLYHSLAQIQRNTEMFTWPWPFTAFTRAFEDLQGGHYSVMCEHN